MEGTKCSGVFGSLAIFTMTLALGVTCKAQEQSQEQSREATPPAPEQQRHKGSVEHGDLRCEVTGRAKNRGRGTLIDMSVSVVWPGWERRSCYIGGGVRL